MSEKLTEPQKEINGLVDKALKALEEYANYDQEKIDYIVAKASIAALDQHGYLAKLAVEETKRGVLEDKATKNLFACEYVVNNMRHLKTVGVVEDDDVTGIVKIAEPVGVVAGLTPVTNPTSTAIFKSLICLKTRNPIIFSFHPSAIKCSIAAAKIVYDAAVAAGAPKNCIQWIEEPSLEKTDLLMKNDGVLPLTGEERLHIAGSLFENMRYQGAGSSMINPTRRTTPKDAFQAHGIQSHSIADCDTVLYFAGLTDEYESEGSDRENMRLPDQQLQEIETLCNSGKPVVIILFGGSPVELPFCDRVSAILNMYLPGQNGGAAVYALLFGEKNPSGKLAETWPLRYEDVPGHETFGKGVNEIYSEGWEMGYRYYGKHRIPVRFPFGFGLSYTAFEKTDWVKSGDAYVQTITNTGSRYGAEVAQLYLDGELKGFQKVYLNPGESVTVTITPEPEDTTEYPDTLTIPEEPKKYPVTLESRFADLQQTFLGRILYNSVLSVAVRQAKEAEKLPDGPEKENKRKGAQFLTRILESNSLRSMSMSAGRSMPYNFAQGFVELTNGHLFRGIGCFLKKIKVPALPKDAT